MPRNSCSLISKTCDKCGKELKDSDWFWVVRGNRTPENQHDFLLCVRCMNRGLLAPDDKEND